MYRLILFDVDGVFLSEERCFDSSALAVWELLHAPHFLNLPNDSYTSTPSQEKISSIRKQVFADDQVLDWMKKRGINANWDMVYLAFTAQLLLLLRDLERVERKSVHRFLQEPMTEESLQEIREQFTRSGLSFQPSYADFSSLFQEEPNRLLTREELLVYFNRLANEWFGIPVTQFSRNCELWDLGRTVYQEWYLGADLYRQVEEKEPYSEEKTGFLSQEIPLAAPETIGETLDFLRDRGIELGIGTGRPAIETEVPLETLGLLTHFSSQRIISASDVVKAEQAFPDLAPLGKPQPFTYIKGYLGREVSDQKVLDIPLPLNDAEHILIVGDSVADFLAAQKMGCHFAATLTGLTGLKARSTFEELGADYILDDVTQLRNIFD